MDGPFFEMYAICKKKFFFPDYFSHMEKTTIQEEVETKGFFGRKKMKTVSKTVTRPVFIPYNEMDEAMLFKSRGEAAYFISENNLDDVKVVKHLC
jgi:hypothetical protein